MYIHLHIRTWESNLIASLEGVKATYLIADTGLKYRGSVFHIFTYNTRTGVQVISLRVLRDSRPLMSKEIYFYRKRPIKRDVFT